MLRIVPYTNLLLVIHDLPALTSEEYRTFCHRFFDKIQNDFPTKDTRFLPGHNKEIMRVTGRRSQDGEITGLFGMPTFLPWHSDQPGIPLDRRPDCLVLYSVEGTANSVTGFSNSILALRDLRLADDAPQGLLENLDRLEVLYDYTADLDQASTNIADHNYRGPPGKNKLVIKNKAGACGILFNNQSTDSFYIGDDKLPYETYKVWRDYLSKFLIQQKYIYAHNWEDHEIIMNCQTLSQHCRLPFIKIQERLLWRIAGYTLPFDTSDIDFGNLKTYICDH
jgi:alpha-ketoglutarate-dependent taurine dioxygenase